MSPSSTSRADQYRCTEIVLETDPDAAIISNLGTASYTLIDIEDRDLNFYMNAAMGVTTPTGFGIALSTDRPVTVLEGDGSLLMSLGALASIGTHDPENLTIVVWDNDVYETTGGQQTLSGAVDFVSVAESCGLAAWRATSDEEFTDAYAAATAHEGSSLISCRVEPLSFEHPRLDYGHSVVKYRFRKALSGEDFRTWAE